MTSGTRTSPTTMRSDMMPTCSDNYWSRCRRRCDKTKLPRHSTLSITIDGSFAAQWVPDIYDVRILNLSTLGWILLLRFVLSAVSASHLAYLFCLVSRKHSVGLGTASAFSGMGAYTTTTILASFRDSGRPVPCITARRRTAGGPGGDSFLHLSYFLLI